MQVKLESQYPLSDEAIGTATGKSFDEWYGILDARGGPSIGRREINNFLYAECKVDIWWCATLNAEYEAARGVKDKDGRAKGYTICSTKTITAPLDKVYDAWTSAAALDTWFGKGNKASVVDGGEFTNADGNQGVFKRVRPNKDLRFTWDGPDANSGTIVDVIFQDKGNGKSYVQITHDRIQTRAEADGLRHAWGEALDRLKAVMDG